MIPDPAGLAALHGQCFFDHPRPWSAAEFRALLDSAPNFLLTERGGFLLGRCIADEAELLTLAVDPALRRQGIARRLLARFAATSEERGAHLAHLEVAADNAAALRLYAGDGWEICGCRRNYYAPGRDAVLMRRVLTPGSDGQAC